MFRYEIKAKNVCLLTDEILECGMSFFSNYINLGKHRELDSIIGCCELLNNVIVIGFLVTKLVARKRKDLESFSIAQNILQAFQTPVCCIGKSAE